MKVRSFLIILLIAAILALIVVSFFSQQIVEKAVGLDSSEKIAELVGDPVRPKEVPKLNLLALTKMPMGTPLGMGFPKKLDLKRARPKPEGMLPAINEKKMQEAASAVGISMVAPPGVEIFADQIMEGRLNEFEMYFKDDDKLGVAVYLFNGEAPAEGVQEFLGAETRTSPDDWEDFKNLGNLKDKGFLLEQTFKMYNEETDNTKFVVYAKAPNNRHLAIVVFGDEESIDNKLQSLMVLYNSLKVIK